METNHNISPFLAIFPKPELIPKNPDPSRKFVGLMVETSHPQNRIGSGKSRNLRTYLDA